jgi:hypothetical protein
MRNWLRRRRQQQRLLLEVFNLGVQQERRRASRLQAKLAAAVRARRGGSGSRTDDEDEEGAEGKAEVERAPRRGAAGAAPAPDEASLRAELAAARARVAALKQTAVRWRRSEEQQVENLRARHARWRAQPGAAAAARLVTPELAAALLARGGAHAAELAPGRLALLLWSAPWLGFTPPPEWAAAVGRALAGAAGHMTLPDAGIVLWAAAHLQPGFRLPPDAARALLERTRELLAAAAAAAPAAPAAPPADVPVVPAARAAPGAPARPAWPPARSAATGADAACAAPGAPGFRFDAAGPRAAAAAGRPPAAGAPGARAQPPPPPVAAPQDLVMLPWALSELGLRPGADWAAVLCGAAARALPRMSGLQLGVMLRALARMRAAVPEAFLEAVETRGLVNSAVWPPNECALVHASIIQLRQAAAEAAAEAAAPRRRGRPRGGGSTSGSDGGSDDEDERRAAAAAVAAEWELLDSLGAGPLQVLIAPAAAAPWRRGGAGGVAAGGR